MMHPAAYPTGLAQTALHGGRQLAWTVPSRDREHAAVPGRTGARAGALPRSPGGPGAAGGRGRAPWTAREREDHAASLAGTGSGPPSPGRSGRPDSGRCPGCIAAGGTPVAGFLVGAAHPARGVARRIRLEGGQRNPPPLDRVLRARARKNPLVLLLDEAHTLDRELGRTLLNASQVVAEELPFLLALAGTPNLETQLNRMGASFRSPGCRRPEQGAPSRVRVVSRCGRGRQGSLTR